MNSINESAIPKGSTVLVTGANGLVGSHVADQFLKFGYKVRGTVRDVNKNTWLSDVFDKTYGKGKFELASIPDMATDGAFDKAIKGVSAVIHVASVMSFDPDPSKVIPPVVSGAVNAIRAAYAELSVKRFVFTSSSTAALSPEPNVPGIIVTESTWNKKALQLAWAAAANTPERAVINYAASKTQSEKEIWKFHDENKHKRLDLVVNTVLPNAVFGKSLDITHQGHPSTSGFIVHLWHGQHKELLQQFQPQHFVDVQDSGVLHVAAAIHPDVKGERIFGFAETFNWDKILDILRKQNPDRVFIENFQREDDLSEIKTRARAEQLLRDLGRPGWTSLEDSIMMNTEDLRRGSYTEYEINQALEAISRGHTIRKAAHEYGIPRTTLQRRLHGAQSRPAAFEDLQRLSISQEAKLASWVQIQADLGLAPTHQQLKEFAQRILHAMGDTQPLGKRWVNAFIRRNPSIKVQRSRSIDSRRVNGASTEIIRDWFKYLAIPQIMAIKPANRYNMDETGILEGKGSNGLVLGRAETKSVRKKQPGSRAWVSIIKCISAKGRALWPLVIYKGKLTVQNIKSGWKYTGLWPVAVAKPLMSSLLLPKASNPPSTPIQGIQDIQDTDGWVSAVSAVAWSTPRKARELDSQLHLFSQLDQSIATQRQLFRKVKKGFQEQSLQLATAQQQIQHLQAQVNNSTARKKRAVKVNPNTKFATISNVRQSQIEAGEVKVDTDGSSASDYPSEAESCIVVAAMPSR
ncbi:aldehyde reductase [Colletotrichum tofieldiae]|uniref:Aldehyde reductase n=1 Tax=Colletotrichum tofieldiae TaxID=708197 RepID=A0A161YLG4_9PEZI|nr:aldehyde reductase [Colletotrichum tofieldiae]